MRSSWPAGGCYVMKKKKMFLYIVVMFLKFTVLWVFLNYRHLTLVILSCKSRSLLYAELYDINFISTTVWRVT